MSALAAASLTLYLLLLLAMLAYGANSFVLVAIHARRRRTRSKRPPPPKDLPALLVQLPVYNEANVVGRLLEAAGHLDWPADRLEIQLLDDSDDETSAIAAKSIAALRARGLRVTHLRREDRTGYKAGALAHGLLRSRAKLVAIFDADFVPPPSFLREAAGWFGDPRVGAVQGRWTHLNRGYSSLTRAQALGIDGHFGVEQAARSWAGWFLNFNGSGGVWRREAIESAGGWSADTLTEDLDLSYRAQLRGWKLVFDADLVCPSELPVHLQAFKAQQRRWATGSMQTARKLLPAIWRSGSSLGAKIQATLHLTHYAVHPLIALTALLSVPCVLLPGAAVGAQNLWMFLLPFALAMSGPTLLHVYAQRHLEHRRLRPADLGRLTLLGIGIALSNGGAVLEAFGRRPRAFVRTPKLGVVEQTDIPERSYRVRSDGLYRVEAGLAVYCLLSAVGLLGAGVYVVAPFMLLDAAGFATVAAIGFREASPRLHEGRKP